MTANSLPPAPQGAAVDYLLVSPPNLLVQGRIQAELSATDISAEETSLGLRLAADSQWQLRLEALAAALSPAERDATRVAVVPRSDDPMALHRAVFEANSLTQMIHRIHDTWLYDVLENNRVRVFLQPLVQFPPGRIHGYECLIRGVDEQGNIIPSTQLFEAAGRLNLLPKLDSACRLAAVRRIAELGDPRARYFINFLPSSIFDPDYCLRATLQAVQENGVSPEQIAFEVVETEEVTDRRHLGRILQFYRERGFRIALDDVGAGYASLLALAELRPDYIKLAGELVRRAAFSALEGKLVRDLAEAARQNGIITVAEGVENDAQFRFVLDAGIRLTQGYLHARPRLEPLSQPEAEQLFSRLDSLAGATAA